MSYLDRLTLEQKLIAANGVLLVVILVCAAILMMQDRQVPATLPIERIEAHLERVAVETVVPEKVLGRGENFGTQPVFDTIIPIPTPTPSPTPTPIPDPPLAEAIASWKVNGLGIDSIYLSDVRTRKEWTMYVGDEEIVNYGNVEMSVKLQELDTINFAGVFVFEGKQGTQEFKRSMFDE